MKFNFGTGIVIAMGIFMVFILQYVIRVQMDSSLDNELVTENYYQLEVEVDGKNERTKEADKLMYPVVISTLDKGIAIDFPKDFDFSKIQGTISFYRPSDMKLDHDVDFGPNLSSSQLVIPAAQLAGGRWDVAVEWKYAGKAYRNVMKVNL